MNVMTARKIADYVAELKVTSATFTAKFGVNYKVNENSPACASQLANHAMKLQTQIASLLAPVAIQNAFSRFGTWWERSEMVPPSIVNELGSIAFDLIGRSAYNENSSTGETDWDSTIVIEQSIAGLLHPYSHSTSLIHENQYQEVS